MSRSARDLIHRLLQEKEYRLSCRKYLLNDIRCARASDSSTSTDWAESHFRDHRGYFIFPDDASDIKAHHFFNGIDWNRLHLMKPPEIPKVRNCLDTRYFDIGSSISDVDDASTTSSMQERQMEAQQAFEQDVVKEYEVAMAQHADQLDGPTAFDDVVEADMIKEAAARVTQAAAVDVDSPSKNVAVQPKERKRPRDRILRDLSMAKEALEQRKKGAFIGYTYRRPVEILASLADTRNGCWMETE